LPRACPPNGEQASIKNAIYKRRDQKKIHNIINISNKGDEEECEEVKKRVVKVVILQKKTLTILSRAIHLLHNKLQPTRY
jgi:hypothetical protein